MHWAEELVVFLFTYFRLEGLIKGLSNLVDLCLAAEVPSEGVSGEFWLRLLNLIEVEAVVKVFFTTR